MAASSGKGRVCGPSESDDSLAQELELLEAIYISELTVDQNVSDAACSLSLELHPATAEDIDTQYVRITLVLKLSENYPQTVPEILIQNSRGLSDEQLTSLHAKLYHLAEERQGCAMLYELIELAKESLTRNNLPSVQCVICLYELMKDDEFIKTTCYHYFHSHCLANYIEHALHEEEQVVCLVCREDIEYDLDLLRQAELPRHLLEPDTYVPNSEMRKQQEKMAALFQKQKNKGAIIDIEAEKNKFLIDISATQVESQHDVSEQQLTPSDTKLDNHEDAEKVTVQEKTKLETKKTKIEIVKDKNSRKPDSARPKSWRPYSERPRQGRDRPHRPRSEKYYTDRGQHGDKFVKKSQRNSAESTRKESVNTSERTTSDRTKQVPAAKSTDTEKKVAKNNDDCDKINDEIEKKCNINDSHVSDSKSRPQPGNYRFPWKTGGRGRGRGHYHHSYEHHHRDKTHHYGYQQHDGHQYQRQNRRDKDRTKMEDEEKFRDDKNDISKFPDRPKNHKENEKESRHFSKEQKDERDTVNKRNTEDAAAIKKTLRFHDRKVEYDKKNERTEPQTDIQIKFHHSSSKIDETKKVVKPPPGFEVDKRRRENKPVKDSPGVEDFR
ncbi:uncharacterized protein LOC102804335 [Saccoglossus kowalevskii]|uniref:E3 ubiquitin-protein ligase RNF25-like n=1 Tax=Saccoglossus kowalevskii TaxID=10224 RepID=A0ABM0MDJ4_SACKO|nr:PREDICTED: E3 ubiquitin-protein ligase RNF25-like [Saccoglossus kowalevskii]